MTITGWADTLHTIYNEIGGYYCFPFVKLSCCAHVPYIVLAARLLSAQLKEHGLL
jgi:hypothetical protein